MPESPDGVRKTRGSTGEPQEGTSLRVCDPVPSVSLDDSLEAISRQLTDYSSSVLLLHF